MSYGSKIWYLMHQYQNNWHPKATLGWFHGWLASNDNQAKHLNSLNRDNYQFWVSLPYIFLENLRTFILPPNLTRDCRGWANPGVKPLFHGGQPTMRHDATVHRLPHNTRQSTKMHSWLQKNHGIKTLGFLWHVAFTLFYIEQSRLKEAKYSFVTEEYHNIKRFYMQFCLRCKHFDVQHPHTMSYN